ncbi:hypothetical protein RBS60_13865 [Sinomonas sp. ASV486]|uniref:hypothetical protein n=1 Tax=Sinomonas sp. ASV486 TaxID=3051170 RepID=UPI0027DD89C9|nr:hypothetical protein [Sinomonas sp. ASV486]MDQ4491283.1 hypothetical protein [Sinomonas sp. ASV486]
MTVIQRFIGAHRVAIGAGLALLVTGAALVPAAVAASVNAGQTFYACLTPGQTLSSVGTTQPQCATHDQTISWNSIGPQGPAGPAGPQGPSGLTGAQGPAGPAGGSERFWSFSGSTTYYALEATITGSEVLPAGTVFALDPILNTISSSDCRTAGGDFFFDVKLNGVPLSSPTTNTTSIRLTADTKLSVTAKCYGVQVGTPFHVSGGIAFKAFSLTPFQ